MIQTATRVRYEAVESQPFRLDRRHKICFENADVEKAFARLLEHRCIVDADKEEEAPVFRTFKQLESHVRREYQLFYCDLCIEHLKVSK